MNRFLGHLCANISLTGPEPLEDGEMNETYWPEEGSNLRSPTFQAGRFNHCTRAQAIAFERRVSLAVGRPDGSFDSVVA